MLIVYPDYYKEFSCVAGACEDTCCAGWEIVIDAQSLKKYHESKTFRKRLLRDIKWRKGTFRQCKDGRCAFLREDGLCEMYRQMGADSLCKTCRTYPRHIEEFENVREYTLSVSCPYVARLLLNRQTPVTFLEEEREMTKSECYESFDYFLYGSLLDARTEMIRILQNRELRIEERLLLVLGIAHDIERRYRQNRLGETTEVLERAKKESSLDTVRKCLEQWSGDSRRRYAIAKKHFERLCELERLREDWDQVLIDTQMLLYVQGANAYRSLQQEFREWTKVQAPWLDIQIEQLAVYFISTYFAGAVYDGRIYGKVDTMVAYLALIYEICVARWLKNEKMLEQEDVIEVVYRFSREIEHSDENLEQMECALWWRLSELTE